MRNGTISVSDGTACHRQTVCRVQSMDCCGLLPLLDGYCLPATGGAGIFVASGGISHIRPSDFKPYGGGHRDSP